MLHPWFCNKDAINKRTNLGNWKILYFRNVRFVLILAAGIIWSYNQCIEANLILEKVKKINLTVYLFIRERNNDLLNSYIVESDICSNSWYRRRSCREAVRVGTIIVASETDNEHSLVSSVFLLGNTSCSTALHSAADEVDMQKSLNKSLNKSLFCITILIKI